MFAAEDNASLRRGAYYRRWPPPKGMPPPGRPNDPPAGAAGGLNVRCAGACICGGVYARWKDGGGACRTGGAANVRAAGGGCELNTGAAGGENARVGFTAGGTVNVRGGGW